MPRAKWLLVVAAAFVVALIAGTGGAIAFENNDQSCDSCHTEPEVTYVAQIDEAVESAIAPTLAAFHAHTVGPFADREGMKAARCIDCHSGPHPIWGRAESLLKAAQDTVAFIAGTAEMPATLDAPFPDANCTKCHTDDYTRDESFENHFHTLLSDPEAPGDIRCADCHLAHQPANDFEHFILRPPTFATCEHCHQEMGRGPTNMQP